jgi:hypothetical protein
MTAAVPRIQDFLTRRLGEIAAIRARAARIAHRVKDFRDCPIVDEQRQTFEIGFAARRERRQTERGGEAAFGVAENWERQGKPLGKLALIASTLKAEAEETKSEPRELRTRKPSSSGVEPCAPGMSSQLGGLGWLGHPVHG